MKKPKKKSKPKKSRHGHRWGKWVIGDMVGHQVRFCQSRHCYSIQEREVGPNGEINRGPLPEHLFFG